MPNIKTFVFNPFQVNTYVIYDDTKEAVIIDAACYEAHEQQKLVDFLESEGLKLVKSITTHCHIDHILGNGFIEDKFGLKPLAHKAGELFLSTAKDYGLTFGLQLDKAVMPEEFIEDGDIIKFGNTEFEAKHIPGHADGSICLISHTAKAVFTGDVIFDGSIGRTDLPTGNMELLLQGIKEKLYNLPDDYILYCGHGPTTNVGKEKQTNPFVNG